MLSHLLALTALTAFAADAKTDTKTETKTELYVAKSEFLDAMKSGLPDTFCADKTYFRKCFGGTKTDCVKEVNAAAEPCLEKLSTDMPAQLHQPVDGQSWGEKIGNCVGTKYEQDLGKQKTKGADCEDPAKWK